jgi:adenylate cyclase
MLTLRTALSGLGAGLLAVGLALTGTLDRAELGILDRLFEWRGPRTPAAPIVIVNIDEDSFDELDMAWPFPRALHARLLDRLSAGRPLAIGVDILFPESSPRGPDDDAALADAVARAGNVILAAAITHVSEGFYSKLDLNLPLPATREGAAGVAPVNEHVDEDGRLRRAILFHWLADQRIPSWDVALYRVIERAGVPVAPLPAADVVPINFRGGPGTFPWVSYHRVVSGEVPPELFEGKIVLIGATSPILQDIFSTPFGRARQMSGVEIHAHALDMLVRGDHLQVVNRWVSLAAAVLAAVAVTWLATRLRALRAFLAAIGVWAALAAVTFALFALGNLWFQAGPVSLGLMLGYGVTVIDSFVREQRERRRLARFFSPAVLREIVRQRSDRALSSQRRLVTVLFTDIRGFTSISEKVQPEQVAAMLSEYLTEMTEVVFRHRGTVDKYIGDCIMALYNAPFDDPDHAANAVQTALELQERTLAVSAHWEAELGVQIRIGVGISTGEVVVGTLGSRQRLEYTAIGDTVNLASRLEGLTKEHHTGVIISESTHALVSEQFLVRELGAVPVRGKALPVRIYGILPADLRKHPRTALDAAATVVAVVDGRAWTVRTRDVSEGGLAVIGLPATVGPQARVEIRGEGGALPAPLTAEGVIVWRDGEAAGIAFTALPPDVRLPGS